MMFMPDPKEMRTHWDELQKPFRAGKPSVRMHIFVNTENAK